MGYDIPEVKAAFDLYSDKMNKTIIKLKEDFRDIRAGRANPHILDKITVEAYGVPTPLPQLGNIGIPEARVMTITLWDSSLLKAAEKAILAANIGLTPNNDGKLIRLIFPELTGERRKELCKGIKVSAEAAKVALRNERRDILEKIKKMKNKVITEDDVKVYEKDIEKQFNPQIELVDKLAKEKEQEIMTV